MSDNWIILIPEQAGFVPPADKQQQALSRFRNLAPAADEVKIELSEKIRFVDCGSNFERILCPDCKKELDISWWQKQINEDFVDSDFQLLSRKMPCCGTMRNLHELRYDWPQGLARFGLEAMNPNLGKLPEAEISSLESILGCPLRVIYQHI
jgi:hypothetical protein